MDMKKKNLGELIMQYLNNPPRILKDGKLIPIPYTCKDYPRNPVLEKAMDDLEKDIKKNNNIKGTLKVNNYGK